MERRLMYVCYGTTCDLILQTDAINRLFSARALIESITLKLSVCYSLISTTSSATIPQLLPYGTAS